MMEQRYHWYDYITINIYWLGLNMMNQTMSPLVAPLLVQKFVGEESKATYYGNLRLWSLMVALLIQSLMGMFSDHSQMRFGRRRPFILIGTLADLIIITGIGFSAGLEGFTGYWILFILVILLNISSNTAQGAIQGLIPDLVPENQRGRFSGVKALMELPLPLIIISFTVGRMVKSGDYWGGILIMMAVLTISMILTMLVKEKPAIQNPRPIEWKRLIRFGMMTGFFTIIILCMREIVRYLGNVFASIMDIQILTITMGIIGSLAMLVTVVIGVWGSIKISASQSFNNKSSFIWWVVNRLAFLVGAFNLSSFIIYFIQARFGYAAEKAAGPATTLTMVIGICVLLTAIPAGWLTDKLNRKLLVGVSGIAALFGTLMAIIVPDLYALYIAGAIIGIATGLFYTSNWALGTSIVPASEAGQFLGISNLAGAGAGAIGAYIGGPIADFFTQLAPDQPGLGYIVLFAIYGCLFLTSVISLIGIKITVYKCS
jgi:MFS family permease